MINVPQFFSLTEPTRFLAEAAGYARKLDVWAARHEMGKRMVPDHICHKCASSDEYAQMLTMLERISTYIHQATVSGRRIAYARLVGAHAVRCTLGPIAYVELSDQKPNGSQTSGFDHIEVVVDRGTRDELVDLHGFIRSGRTHHETHDLHLKNGLQIRLEEEPLVRSIAREMLDLA